MVRQGVGFALVSVNDDDEFARDLLASRPLVGQDDVTEVPLRALCTQRNEMKDRLLVDELRTKAVEIVRLHAEMYLPLVAVAVASGLAVGADGAAHSDNGGGGGEEGSAVVKMEEG